MDIFADITHIDNIVVNIRCSKESHYFASYGERRGTEVTVRQRGPQANKVEITGLNDNTNGTLVYQVITQLLRNILQVIRMLLSIKLMPIFCNMFK